MILALKHIAHAHPTSIICLEGRFIVKYNNTFWMISSDGISKSEGKEDSMLGIGMLLLLRKRLVTIFLRNFCQ